ncbi:hypothetical protein [Emcibacter nanhaiensis]|uniref:hypothetical protein n=1 Tax=Emcibacter nanhaiensis TaxID=1505037 RepID=UPI001C616A7C|nr:hypothetical protein [Emcibacter nanhaiensis]
MIRTLPLSASLETTVQRHIAAEQLPPDFDATVRRYYLPVAERIAALQNRLGRPLVVGVNGAQGSGKSTLSAFLKLILENNHDLRTVVISIDDLYLTRAEREQLARDIHPLLVTRGVPGTHDVGLGIQTITKLLNAKEDDVTLIPRFDKARDDRCPQEDWDRFKGRADIVILEGWCVGARPQPDEDLANPVNDLERNEDPAGAWRRHVNNQLKGPYRELFGLLDYLVMLLVPSFDCVLDFRLKQERKLAHKLETTGVKAENLKLMDEAAIHRFIMHYERLTRFMLTDLPAIADALLEVDADHSVTGLSFKDS